MEYLTLSRNSFLHLHTKIPEGLTKNTIYLMSSKLITFSFQDNLYVQCLALWKDKR